MLGNSACLLLKRKERIMPHLSNAFGRAAAHPVVGTERLCWSVRAVSDVEHTLSSHDAQRTDIV